MRCASARAVDIPAFGGRLEVNWAPGARVTSVGGLVYFATFLKATGLFDMRQKHLSKEVQLTILGL